jgi:2-polyprenyl-3-methyl-5-hydroxy-6-metoxy-1,4-benzoquinol methylase
VSDPLRYTAHIDLRNVNDSHAFAVAAVPAGSDVLDVGAADGSVARMLGQIGCRVWGVENDSEAARIAQDWCEDVIVGDIEQLDLKGALGRRFDVILFLDILEHLKDPLTVLRSALDLLSDRGHVVISLPNVAHAAMRAQLLGGHFSYTPTGLLDNTHLRFFDPTSVHQFLRDAGLAVLDEDRVTLPIDGTEIAVRVDELDPGVAEQFANDPESDSYQFLFVAAPEGSAAVTDPTFLPARVLQRELRAAQQHIEELESQMGVRAGLNRPEMTERLAHLLRSNRNRRRALRTLVEMMDANIKLLDDIAQKRDVASST